MKKIFMLLSLLTMCVCLNAKKPTNRPIVDVDVNSNGRIVLLNDSTIEYIDVFGIQVAQPSDVYSAIIRMPESKKERPTLVIMRPGSYIWVDETNKHGHYILYCGRALNRVILRATDTVDLNLGK